MLAIVISVEYMNKQASSTPFRLQFDTISERVVLILTKFLKRFNNGASSSHVGGQENDRTITSSDQHFRQPRESLGAVHADGWKLRYLGYGDEECVIGQKKKLGFIDRDFAKTQYRSTRVSILAYLQVDGCQTGTGHHPT